ncbi:MAG: HU family DNA-binding protein [Bacteroidaceae bacterium]|nr:HU family DNA-binding protein [Bacteroidaceae bacterium]MBR1789696.1 HU family DNA-binding protein [Bacteroidaceae bacterium]
MNNKEFLNELSKRTGFSAKETAELMAALTNELAEQFEEEATVSVMGFGNFEVKKKLERVLINPSTKQRMLVPPKMVLTFKPSATLKEKL